MAASWLMRLCKLRTVSTFGTYALAQMESFSRLQPRIRSSGYVLPLHHDCITISVLKLDAQRIAVFGALGLGYRQEANHQHIPK